MEVLGLKFKIKELCEINSSNYTKKDNFAFINYLDTSNITEGKIDKIQKLVVGKDKIPSRAKRKVKKNDIIISTVRPNLKHFGIIKEPVENMIVSTGFAVLSPNSKLVNPEYLYWYLAQQHITDYLAGIAETSTTAYPSITADVIGDIEIELPVRNVQDKIANILSVLDDKMLLDNKINKTLEQIAQTIFKHWFIDFEFPNEEGKPYKSSGGKFVDSELGMIPEGWEVHRLDEVTNVNIGKTPPRKEKQWFTKNSNDIRWISIKDLGESGLYIFNTTEYLTKEAIERFKIKIIPNETVVLSFKLTIGRVAITIGEMVSNEAIAHFLIKDNKINSPYLYLYLKRFNFETLGNTSSIANAINSKIVKSIPIIVPEINVMNNFLEKVKPLFNLIKKNIIEIETLKKLRNTLLPKLMSGEIRVPEAEEVVENHV